MPSLKKLTTEQDSSTTFSRPLCITEGCNNLARKGDKPGRFRSKCSSCSMGRSRHSSIHLKYRKGHCEECGFVPVHPVQLDVDHKDGDKTNTDPSNYITLCANCHRLKTHLNRDYLNLRYRNV